ncbi:MAG: DUF6108 family protein [Bacteroidales bacterium]|nr:DUF6108 family protein [Bacteroidales bacterium]
MIKRIQLLFCLLMVMCTTSWAQYGLNVDRIFSEANKLKGHTDEVVISGRSLKQYNLTFFHSVTVTESSETADEIERLVKKDGDIAETAKEMVRGDRCVGLYYQLPPDEDDKDKKKRFILFRRPKIDCALVVYVEGHTTLDDLVKISFK